MDDICRLCCSKNFVNNNIFDEENALYLKMSLYLPIKVFKNDQLPQKVCDKCSCKVNDFYQFCNETIEVQQRLRSYILSSNLSSTETVDLTRIKDNNSPPPLVKREQGTQTDCDDATFTSVTKDVQVKLEPVPLSPIKEENIYDDYDGGLSDNSDDISLITLKEKKKTKTPELNGVKKPRKKKPKLSDLEIIMNALPKGTKVSVVTDDDTVPVKEEVDDDFILNQKVDVKSELKDTVYNCCICMMQIHSKKEMLIHYRSHGAEYTPVPPATPPLPDSTDPLRCPRCRKSLSAAEWAAHWARHWSRDTRPYRCALCVRAFRHEVQILKHGLTHEYGQGAAPEPLDKMFKCDLCADSFVYMRCLQAHRTRDHPEASSRALVLRCGECSRSFAHINSLRRHMRAHSGRRDHLCNVCGKALSSSEHLKFHIRIHTGYKPNVCKTCGKGFVKKCNLTLHERVHSGEKPHVCTHCGKAFSQRSTLVIHERYHSGARPYVCSLCGRGFVAKGLLSMHLKTTCI